MIDRHTKMNIKVQTIWLLALAAIWLLWGCKCGKMVSQNNLVVDSTAQSEETTIIEVVAARKGYGQQTTDNGTFARIANKTDRTHGELKLTTLDGQCGEYAAHRTNTTANNGLFARIANKKNRTRENGGLNPTTRNGKATSEKQTTDTDDIVADLIENGGGVVKITRTNKATSTTDRQQQQLNREIQRRNDWLFNLGVVVAVGMWVARRLRN
ncbi:MAG: hypothetical protein IKZ99_13175 [Salinivirgaceae bacterium]|nr:hypothetical protein [Salinivirgaceae bacterium]